jgi:hypothetical protein
MTFHNYFNNLTALPQAKKACHGVVEDEAGRIKKPACRTSLDRPVNYVNRI